MKQNCRELNLQLCAHVEFFPLIALLDFKTRVTAE